MSTRKSIPHAKTDVRYWLSAIYQETHGAGRQDLVWSCKIQHAGIRKPFPLSANKHESAARARDIYLSLKARGWENTLSEFKPNHSTPQIGTSSILTVGDFLHQASKHCQARPRSIECYCSAFRRIVAQSFGIDDPKKRDGKNGGRDRWKAKVDSVLLANLTPERVQEWKQNYLKNAEKNAIKEREARNNVNSTLRNAKSLFSKKISPFLNLDLPFPSPFENVSFEPKPDMRYRSQVDVMKIIELAQVGSVDEEIKPIPLEQWKIFLLAVTAGLRRREIDLLEWSSLRFDENVICLKPTKWFAAKNEASYGDVHVDSEVMDLFQSYRSDATSEFVIESETPPQLNPVVSWYRCNRHFKPLVKWLRSVGLESREPLHQLRKEFGTKIANDYDIFSAKEQLRHSTIALTSAVYVASRKRLNPGFGFALEVKT